MLSKKIVLAFLSVSMIVFVAAGQAYARDNVAYSGNGGVATFLDPGDQSYMGLWDNINDGTDAYGVNVDWSNYPYQATPTWQVTLPGVFGIDTGGVVSWSHGDLGRNIDDYVVEWGLNGDFSPVISMRDYDFGSQSNLWYGPSYYGYTNNTKTGGNNALVQVMAVDTIRVTEFNTSDVDNGPRPHVHPSLDEIVAYNRDAGPTYTRPATPAGVILSADGEILTWDGVIGAVGYNVWISRAGVGSLSSDYFCVNQLSGPSILNDGMITGTSSYALPLAWQGFAADLYAITSVDSTGTNSFYSEPAVEAEAPSCPDADGDGVIDSVETAGGWDPADSADNPMADLETALDDLDACQTELATTQAALAAAQACISETNEKLGTTGCPADSVGTWYLPPGIDKNQPTLSRNPNAVVVKGVKQ